MNTFAVSFLVRPSKVNKVGESPIELSLCINAERTYINRTRKVKPSLFDCKKQVIKGRSAEAKELNEFLSLMKSIYSISLAFSNMENKSTFNCLVALAIKLSALVLDLAFST